MTSEQIIKMAKAGFTDDEINDVMIAQRERDYNYTWGAELKDIKTFGIPLLIIIAGLVVGFALTQ